MKKIMKMKVKKIKINLVMKMINQKIYQINLNLTKNLELFNQKEIKDNNNL